MKDILKDNIYSADLRRALENNSILKFNNYNILITGGLGLIGSTIVDLLIFCNELNDAKINIYIADINEVAYQIRYIDYKCVNYIKYDSIRPIDFKIHFDYIIYASGISSPELYVEKPVETILSNFNGVLNLLEYSRQTDVKRFLYISSSEVYGIKDTIESFNEDTFGSININNIRSSYAEAKRASEMLCKAYSYEYDIDTVIVRPGHIYGPTASKNDRRVVSQFTYLASRGQKIEMKSSGLQKRSYCYSIDCGVAILVALLNGKKSESYNIGHDQITTIAEMAKLVANAGNVKLEIKEPTNEELKQFNPMNNSTLNNSKIKEIGYKDSFTVEEGLSHTVKILKNIND